MLKPFSRTLLALALLSPLTAQAQQGDAARQKELEAARTDLRRAAQRVAELSRGTDTLRAPIRIDRVVAGRPRLGVVAREVTLLPRHWEWLSAQPGGASVALRKLVEEARRVKAPEDRRREAQESAYRFMTVMAGNEPGFEEALRALYSEDRERFEMYSAAWPKDVREHARELAGAAFSGA